MALRLVIVVCLLWIGAVPGRQASDCEPPVWGDTVVVAFENRVRAYVDLRDWLEAAPPRLVAAGNVAQVSSARRALATRIRKARAKSRQGDLFSAAIATEIKKSLRRAVDAHTWKVIMDDNPGEQPSQVNDEYREGSPLATMPPNVLAELPRLPDDVEYRFIERHLILLDTRAMVIVDRIPFAIVDPGSAGSCR